MSKTTIDESLDSLVALDAKELAALIEKFEGKLRLLRALANRETPPAAPAKQLVPVEFVPEKPQEPEEPEKAAEPDPQIPTGSLAEQVGAYLHENGPRRRDAIRNALGMTDVTLSHVLKHAWFEKDGPRFTLSSEGHRKFSEHDDEDEPH